MKIGIITMPLGMNYGGILQAYALQKVLEKYNQDPKHIFIKYRFSQLSLSEKTYAYSKRILKNILGMRTPILLERTMSRLLPIVTQNTTHFINNNISSVEYNSYYDIKEDDFDAYIVGSDQIWRPKYLANKIDNSFLDFTDSWNVKRIAYAASFGTDAWEYTEEQERKCRELVKKFDAVSVREDSGIQLCKDHLNINSEVVLDPTLLLDKENYSSLIEQIVSPKSKGNLYYYILDESEEKMDLVRDIANEYRMMPFKVNAKHIDDFRVPDNEKVLPPVEQWIRGFHDADFVVTDSFHGCVFSIIFQKQFVVLGNKKRGQSRFTSLLKLFGLEDRLVSSVTECHGLRTIDYDIVRGKVNKWQEKSLNYLNHALDLI